MRMLLLYMDGVDKMRMRPFVIDWFRETETKIYYIHYKHTYKCIQHKKPNKTKQNKTDEVEKKYCQIILIYGGSGWKEIDDRNLNTMPTHTSFIFKQQKRAYQQVKFQATFSIIELSKISTEELLLLRLLLLLLLLLMLCSVTIIAAIAVSCACVCVWVLLQTQRDNENGYWYCCEQVNAQFN